MILKVFLAEGIVFVW